MGAGMGMGLGMVMGTVVLERCSGMSKEGRLTRASRVVIVPVLFHSERTT